MTGYIIDEHLQRMMTAMKMISFKKNNTNVYYVHY